jgi:hypothetical protein
MAGAPPAVCRRVVVGTAFMGSSGNSGYVGITPGCRCAGCTDGGGAPGHRPTRVMVDRTGRGDACVALFPSRDQSWNARPPIPPRALRPSDAIGLPHPSGIGVAFRDRRATHASPLPVRGGQSTRWDDIRWRPLPSVQTSESASPASGHFPVIHDDPVFRPRASCLAARPSRGSATDVARYRSKI